MLSDLVVKKTTKISNIDEMATDLLQELHIEAHKYLPFRLPGAFINNLTTHGTTASAPFIVSHKFMAFRPQFRRV